MLLTLDRNFAIRFLLTYVLWNTPAPSAATWRHWSSYQRRKLLVLSTNSNVFLILYICFPHIIYMRSKIDISDFKIFFSWMQITTYICGYHTQTQLYLYRIVGPQQRSASHNKIVYEYILLFIKSQYNF